MWRFYHRIDIIAISTLFGVDIIVNNNIKYTILIVVHRKLGYYSALNGLKWAHVRCIVDKESR